MNKKWALYAGLLILFVLAAAATVHFLKVSANPEPALSVKQAVKLMEQEGIDLTRTQDSREEPINGVKPTAFYINDSKHQLMIYCYDSINERKTAWEMWRDSDRVKSFFSEPGTSAKNLMLIIIPEDEKELTFDSMQELSRVSNIVFEKLNDTREIIFTGAGEHWESKTVVKYYEYPPVSE